MSQSLCDHVTKRSVTERAGGGVCHPESKSKLCLFAFKSGSPEQTKIYLFAMGKSEGTSCPNDRAERYRSMQSRYRTRQTKIYLFAMGRAEVRVALIWVPKINDQIVYFGRAEVHVAQ